MSIGFCEYSKYESLAGVSLPFDNLKGMNEANAVGTKSCASTEIDLPCYFVAHALFEVTFCRRLRDSEDTLLAWEKNNK